jgi:hypothetical protein
VHGKAILGTIDGNYIGKSITVHVSYRHYVETFSLLVFYTQRYLVQAYVYNNGYLLIWAYLGMVYSRKIGGGSLIIKIQNFNLVFVGSAL